MKLPGGSLTCCSTLLCASAMNEPKIVAAHVGLNDHAALPLSRLTWFSPSEKPKLATAR
jgi:hypothetical protein